MKFRPFLLDIIIWSLITIIALIDFITPFGYSFWQPYVAVLLLSFWSERKYYVYFIAVVCTILIIADFLISPHELYSLLVPVHSMMAIVVLWIVAVLCALHKKAIFEIKKSNEKLELKVKERTEELKKAVDQLKESNNELEQFAYVASHDLQEPLRMITAYITLLAKKYEGQLDPKADEYIGYVVDGSKRMQLLISDLLKYARLTTRQKPFELANFSKVVEDVIEDLQINIKETQASIKIDPLPQILADPTQIRQLFQNLITNAIKFHSDLPPVIIISAQKDKNEWCFCISDNGIGMEPKYYERVFMMFQRLHDREKYPGTGIGLTVCKKIVERHGGRIWVESVLGKGSSFYFTMPAV